MPPEKTGQAVIFRHMLLDSFDDLSAPEQYFSNNPCGAMRPMNPSGKFTGQQKRLLPTKGSSRSLPLYTKNRE